MLMKSPFIDKYVTQFSMIANRIVPYPTGPIHLHAYPNHVTAFYLDNDCKSFKVDEQLLKRFKNKTKKFPVTSKTLLGTMTRLDGVSSPIYAIQGNLLELHDIEPPFNEWSDYLALITTKRPLSIEN